MRVYLISLVCVFSLAFSGCGISLTPADESPDLPPLSPQEIPTQPAPATSLPDSPTQGDTTPMNPSLPTMQNLVDKAKEDLIQRFSISASQISLVEARDVVWPNSSLGCPEKGMVYAEVLTPGYLVVLESSGNTFEYHAGFGGDIIYCENPTPPTNGTPSNT